MKHIIPQLDLEEMQNLSDVTLTETSDSIIQEKIAYRRKRVNQLRLRGYTNQQIADKIGCNLSTIEKDLHVTRENTKQWFEENSVIEYCQSLNDCIIVYDNAIEDLQILYTEDCTVESKLRILSMIAQFEEKKIMLYEKTRSVQQYLVRKKFRMEEKKI